MYKFLSVSMLLLLSSILYGQTNQQNSKKKADSLYRKKDYANAAPFYLAAAAKDEFKINKQAYFYRAAQCYALTGKADSAFVFLNLSVKNGNKDVENIKTDPGLASLYPLPQWQVFVASLNRISNSSPDPYKAKLVTTDVKNFWKAYDLGQKDTAHRAEIYKKYYLDAGTEGLHDYWALKVKSMKTFVAVHDKKPNFYAAMRKSTFAVDSEKPEILKCFVKMKEIYPEAQFPDIYFVMGCLTSAGTVSGNGLLLGVDQCARTADVPVNELSLWEQNNSKDLKYLSGLVSHEMVHFNQQNLADDTTTLQMVLIEGMADFIGEKVSGQIANQRLHTWAKGKEKQVWAEFEKDMLLNRAYNWIGNAKQETKDKPADLGYWIGYQICKAYYDKSPDKKQAIKDMLNIKNYKDFYEKSGADKLF